MARAFFSGWGLSRLFGRSGPSGRESRFADLDFLGGPKAATKRTRRAGAAMGGNRAAGGSFWNWAIGFEEWSVMGLQLQGSRKTRSPAIRWGWSKKTPPTEVKNRRRVTERKGFCAMALFSILGTIAEDRCQSSFFFVLFFNFSFLRK